MRAKPGAPSGRAHSADTIAMAQLQDFHADPADRLITAVAINAGLTLITSDR